jgi:hypothetical protein
MNDKPISETIIPATPGYFVTGIEFADARKALEATFDARRRLLIREPVIGWRIAIEARRDGNATFTTVTAITPTGEQCEHGDYSALEMPDGQLTDYAETWPGMDEFLQSAACKADEAAALPRHNF